MTAPRRKPQTKNRRPAVPAKAEPRIPPKELLFREEYLVDFNATQAAIRAGYSARTAGEAGHELLRKPRVSEYIFAKLRGRLDAAGVTQERTVEELRRLAFSNVRRMVDARGALLDPGDMPDEVAACISTMEVEETYTIEDGERVAVGRVKRVKLWDKNAALEKVMRYLGMSKGIPLSELIAPVQITKEDSGVA